MTNTERILAFNEHLSEPSKQAKFAAMKESPFRFLRGTCHLFYEEFVKINTLKDPTKAWICGDMHLENFGTFKGSNRLVYFDINDFDESVLAPCSWDIVRFLTAIEVGVGKDLSTAAIKELKQKALEVYCKAVELGKAMMMERELAHPFLSAMFQQIEKRKRSDFIAMQCERKPKGWKLKFDDVRTFKIDKPKKDKLIAELQKALSTTNGFETFRILDVANREAGTGSIGVERYKVLFEQSDDDQKLRLLEIKEARHSSLLPHLTIKQPVWKTEAERMQTLQHRLQFNPPAMLGAMTMGKKSFLIRQLQPWQDKVDLAVCKTYKNWTEVLHSMAQLIAFAHLRGTGRQGSSTADELIAFASGDTWRNESLLLSDKMAKSVANDYKQFVKAAL